MYTLDNSKAKTWQMSSDTFFYLYAEEPMLDEANMEEAEEILSQYPLGYEVSDNWAYIDDDLIAATLTPYIEQVDIPLDVRTLELSKACVFWLKETPDSKAKIWEYRPLSGVTKEKGEYDIKVNKYGKRYFEIPSSLSNQPTILYIDKFR